MIQCYYGGRLGDVIHGLIVPAYIYSVNKTRAQIFLTEHGDTFTEGLERTFNDLRRVLLGQPFVESFEIYEGEPVTNQLWSFRQQPNLESKCWTDIYFRWFIGFVKPQKNFTWLSSPADPLGDCLLVYRGYPLEASTHKYREIINAYPRDKVFFITSREKHWRSSGLEDCTQLLLRPTLEGMFSAIAGCKEYLGDQSAPTAIACALGVKRTVEVNRCRAFYEIEIEAGYTNTMTTFHFGLVPFEQTQRASDPEGL